MRGRLSDAPDVPKTEVLGLTLPFHDIRWATAGLLLGALLPACSAGNDITPLPNGGEPPADCARVDDAGIVTIAADNLEFSVPCMAAVAGDAFTIRLENKEAVPHNVAVYREVARANEILRGETITGPGVSADYEVEALEAGEYYFDCTVHPEMNGDLYVVDG